MSQIKFIENAVMKKNLNSYDKFMIVPSDRVSTYYFTKAFVLLFGLMAAIVGAVGSAYGEVFVATPDTYRSLLGGLQPGDTLSLEAGTYDRGLALSNLHGEPGNRIVITGPETGAPAIFLGSQNQAWNTVQIDNASYLTIQHLKLDGLDVEFIDAVNTRGVTHHITLENLEIVRHGAHQLTVGIATRGPAWDWTIRNNKIIGAGTGMYLGNWQGKNWPFVGGLIEHNLFVDTVGYNVQIKQMNSRSYESGDAIPGMPLETRKTIIRHNVFSKANQPSPSTEGPRPNLLVGHFPLTGPGSDDVYEIYGNFFYENTTEALFQGEGNIALYDNVFVNSSGSAVNIQPHNNVPRNINVFHNTIVATGNGIKVRGANAGFAQRVAGNAVFADTPVSVDSAIVQWDNVTAPYASAANYLLNPAGDPNMGELSLFPLEDALLGDAIDMTTFQSFSDWDLDFNGDLRTAAFRGAYAGEANNNGWILAIDIKPGADTSPTAPGIATQPVSITVTAGEDASFSVVASGSGPLSYQWFRDGNEIAGAITATYTLAGASSSDSGSVYHCEVSNSLGSVSSSGGILTVLPDTTAPTVVAAIAASDTQIDVIFSEAISVSRSEDSANYQIDLGISVISATLNEDGRTVNLIVSPLTADTAYTVSVSNIEDRAQTPNTIAVQSSTGFTYRSADGFEDGNADGWTPLTANRWEVVMDEGDEAYYLNTSDFSSPGEGRLGEYSLLSASYGDFTFTAQAKLGDDVGNNGFADYAVVFGFQNTNNYYYAMFNNNPTETTLFAVINGSRTELTTANINTDWLNDNNYHRIKVSRTGADIKAYFDDSLVMSANDDTFGAGKVGLGSFNDSAYFDDVSVVAGPGSNLDPEISTTSLTKGQVGVISSYAIAATGGTGPYTWRISAGALPAGLTLNISSGVISGTPTTAGTFDFTLVVQDSGSASDTQPLSLTVDPAAPADNSDNSDSGGGALGGWLLVVLLVFRFYPKEISCPRHKAQDIGIVPLDSEWKWKGRSPASPN